MNKINLTTVTTFTVSWQRKFKDLVKGIKH